MKKITRKEAQEIVKNADKTLFKERVRRTKFLESLDNRQESGFSMFGSVSEEYFFESRLCWLEGAYVAAIVMMQAAFETGLKNFHNFMYTFSGTEQDKDCLDNISFYHLIEKSKKDGLISKKEAGKLHGLRKLRNPFVHTRHHKENELMDSSGTSDMALSIKIAEVFSKKESTLEKDAKKAISLSPLYWSITKRFDMKQFLKQFTDENKYNVFYLPDKKHIINKINNVY